MVRSAFDVRAHSFGIIFYIFIFDVTGRVLGEKKNKIMTRPAEADSAGSSHLERFGVTPSGLKHGNVYIRCLYSAKCIDGYGFNEARRQEEEESFHEEEHFLPFFSLPPATKIWGLPSQKRKWGGSFEGSCRCVCLCARRYTSTQRIHGGGGRVKRREVRS